MSQGTQIASPARPGQKPSQQEEKETQRSEQMKKAEKGREKDLKAEKQRRGCGPDGGKEEATRY